jgi:hypothetical protein
MAGEAAPNGADRALDAITGRATVTTRTTYLALLTAAPDDTTTMATMTELTTPATNGYARQAVTWTAPADASGVRRSENEGAVTFGAFTSDLGNVTHCALVSASTGTSGDFLYFWTLDAARNPANGDSISFADGVLYMTLD